MIDLGKAPNGDPWEMDLQSNGSGWAGTFTGIVRRAVRDIIENGYDNDREWFVEVTLANAVYAGTIGQWIGDSDDRYNSFTITEPDDLPMVIAADEVLRFRA